MVYNGDIPTLYPLIKTLRPPHPAASLKGWEYLAALKRLPVQGLITLGQPRQQWRGFGIIMPQADGAEHTARLLRMSAILDRQYGQNQADYAGLPGAIPGLLAT